MRFAMSRAADSLFNIGLFVGSLAVISALPCEARAYEDQVTLGFDAGMLYLGDLDPAAGPTVGISVGYGLGDAWALSARIGYGLLPSGGDSIHAMTVHAEVVYIIDILQFVPFFGLGLDGTLVAGGVSPTGNVGVHALVGVDYLVSRTLAVGLDVRPGFMPFETTRRGPRGFTLQAGLRVSLLFSTW